MGTDGGRRYAAFVSYRHLPRDRRWAVRVMNLLETFATPRALRLQNYPERVGTLFRDEDEIPSSGDLSDEIRGALARSDNLIVVCSPETPGSKWVRREIELFQEMGKGDRIFPLLIAGEPEESFPPELRRRRVATDSGSEWQEVEPIAADVRPRADERAAATERRAVLRLAAALLNCRFDDLARRDDERRRRRMRLAASSMATVLAVAALGGLWWWDQNVRVKVAWCRNYAEQWGKPVCLGELADGPAGRANSYQLLRRGGEVFEMRLVNGSGFESSVPDGASQFVLEDWNAAAVRWVYPEGRSVVLQYGLNGSLIRQLTYEISEDRRAAQLRIERQAGDAEPQAAEGSMLGGGEVDRARRSNIGQHQLTFDERGCIVERRFQPPGKRIPASDALGSFGRIYDCSESGLVATVANVDEEGVALIERSGVARRRQSYDAQSELVGVALLGADGRPVNGAQNYARIEFARDDKGNATEARYLDSEGKPTINKESASAVIQWAYDRRGNTIEARYLDATGRPTPRLDFGAPIVRWQFNERGDFVAASYHDESGELSLRAGLAVARIAFAYDERRNIVDVRYFDIVGQATTRADWSVARIASSYDPAGRLISVSYFDTNDKLALRRDLNVARIEYEANDRGERDATSHFGTDGEPVLRKDLGFARAEWDFDANGNNTEARYFGVKGEPVLNDDIGAARITWEYDIRGNETDQRFFDIDHKTPIPGLTKGAEHIHMTYNELGNLTATEYLSADGRRVLRKGWAVHRIEEAYDVRGGESGERYFDGERRPTIRKDIGAFRIERVRNAQGLETSRSFFDTKEKLVLDTEWGVARVDTRYDDFGNEIEVAYFGTDDKPTLKLDTGAARVAKTRDQLGREIKREFFDVGGQPTLESSWGVARVDSSYDIAGNLVSERYFGVRGEAALRVDLGVAGIDRTFENGRVVAIRYRGLDGQPAYVKGVGVAQIRYAHDRWGNEVEEAYFDAAGQAMVARNSGAHIVRRERDPLGFILAETRFDTANRPVRLNGNIYRWEWSYDGRGNTLEERELDENGQLTARDDGEPPITKRWKYDARGNKIEETYHDAAGNRVVDRRGDLGRIAWTYDDAGNQVGREYFFSRDGLEDGGHVKAEQRFDARGNMTNLLTFDLTDGSATGMGSVRATFDERGLLAETVYLDADGRPAAYEPVGGTGVSASHDQRRRLVRLSILGADGKPTAPEPDVASTVRYSHDDRGYLTGIEFLDATDKPAAFADGFQRAEYVCDLRGNPVRESFFGAQSQDAPSSIERSYDERDEVTADTFLDAGKTVLSGEGRYNAEAWRSVVLGLTFAGETLDQPCSRARPWGFVDPLPYEK